VSRTRHEPRWRTAVAPAALLVAVALWTGDRVLFLAAALPLGYLAYGALSAIPPVSSAISLERELSTDAPFPGEHVDVTLTVHNESDTAIPDLRVVDDVPGGVEPIEGDPEGVVGLRPGESHELTYRLVAQRGAHEFGRVSVRARSLSAAAVSSDELVADGDSGMFCRVYVEDAPVRDQTMQFVGSIPTKTGGSGIEFHSTRTYRRGDPMNRIDWRRLAKTGELTTIDYRVQEAARVLVVVDAREAVAVNAGPEYPSSRELSSYAAELLTGVLLDEGHEVGVAVFGMDLPGTRGRGSPSVLEPSGGDTFRAHVAAVCAAVAEADPSVAEADPSVAEADPSVAEADPPVAEGDPSVAGADSAVAERDADGQDEDGAGPAGPAGAAVGAATPDGGDQPAHRQAARLRGSLDRHTQVMFVTPALDDFPVTVTERLEGHGHAVTVVSPDVTDGGTLGGRLARLQRAERIEDMRELGAPVVDWSLDDPLPLAIAPAFVEVR